MRLALRLLPWVAVAAVVSTIAVSPGIFQRSIGASAPVHAPSSSTAVTVSPATAVPNQQITLFGTGFTPSSTAGGTGPGGVHQITGTGISGITVAGTKLTAPSVSYPISFDANGNWASSLIIPVNPLTLLDSTTPEILIIDDVGLVHIANFTLPGRIFTIDPVSSGRVSTITATGSGYPASNALGTANTTVSIEYAGVSQINATPDATGAMRAEFSVPITAGIPSTNTVKATILGTGTADTATHTVPGAKLTVSPISGPPGGSIIVFGEDFPSFVPVSAINVGVVRILTLPAPTTDGVGSFDATVTIPSLQVGTHAVFAVAGGTTAVATFSVTTGSSSSTSQPSASSGSAAATALAPLMNMDNLLRVWNFDNASKEWTFFDPRPAFASVNSISDLISRRPYWVLVARDQSAVLNNKPETLFEGWNLISW